MEKMMKAYNLPGVHIVITKGQYSSLQKYLTNIAAGFMTIPDKKIYVPETVVYYNAGKPWDECLVNACEKDIDRAKDFVSRMKGSKRIYTKDDIGEFGNPITYINNVMEGSSIRAIVIDGGSTGAWFTTRTINYAIEYAWNRQIPIILGFDSDDFPLNIKDVMETMSGNYLNLFMKFFEESQSIHKLTDDNQGIIEVYPTKNRAFPLEYHEVADLLF